MPKLIENLREDILRTTGDLIDAGEMDAFNIRAVAKRLGIAPATIYNYFPSKESLIGEIIRGRWQNFVEATNIKIDQGGDISTLLCLVAEGINSFMGPLFPQWMAGSSSALKLKKKEHIGEMHKRIYGELFNMTERILKQGGISPAAAEKVVPTLTKLIVACTHDPELNFNDIIDVCSLINCKTPERGLENEK